MSDKALAKRVVPHMTRRPYKVVAVALANKMARVIWALLTKGGTYRGMAPVNGAANA
jgi:transposase